MITRCGHVPRSTALTAVVQDERAKQKMLQEETTVEMHHVDCSGRNKVYHNNPQGRTLGSNT